MATNLEPQTFTIDKIKYGDNTYILQDSAAEEAIDDIVVAMPADATVTTANNQHTVSILDSASPTPNELFNFNIPASSGGIDLDDLVDAINTGHDSFDGQVSAGTYNNGDLNLYFDDSDTKTSFYGTSSTGPVAPEKAVSCSDFTLRAGNTITILFTYANTTVAPTLRVNQTNPQPIYVNDAVASLTNPCMWPDNTLVDFIYDGSYYRYLGQHRGGKSFYGTCSTTATTAAKTVTCAEFELQKGALITVQTSTAQTYTSAAITLNVNDTGAKTIYTNNAATSSTNTLTWEAGDILQFIYDGTYWRFVSKDINIEEYTDAEISALVLEYPTGSTPLSSATGESF